MNVYTHIGLDDAEEELRKMEAFRKAQAEIDKKKESLYQGECSKQLEKEIES